MLVSETVTTAWNAKKKRYYESLGYTYTGMRMPLTVRVQDLTVGSNAMVTVKCDYCGKMFDIEYFRFLDGRKSVESVDCCNACKKNKIKAVLEKKYGVATPNKVDGAAEKAKVTNLKRYGVENVFASEQIKERIRNSCVRKFGVKNPNQSADIKAKRVATCMEKYGAENHMKTEKYREMFRGENSPRWNGGKTREERERDRSAEEYIAWRKSVFERDHFKCRMCGGKGHGKRGLEAHHIFNYNTNPDLRFLTDNGITFCYDCHKLFHSTYGKRGNNVEQINEFLGHGKKVC